MASTKLDDQTARRRKRVGAGLVIVMAAILIAIVVVRSASEKVLNENADTLVLVGKKTDDAADGVGRGVLADVGGCLGLTDEGSASVVIWPHGTTVVTPDPLRVKVLGTTYKVGDTVEIDGTRRAPLEPSGYFYDRVPEACRTAAVFVVQGD